MFFLLVYFSLHFFLKKRRENLVSYSTIFVFFSKSYDVKKVNADLINGKQENQNKQKHIISNVNTVNKRPTGINDDNLINS